MNQEPLRRMWLLDRVCYGLVDKRQHHPIRLLKSASHFLTNRRQCVRVRGATTIADTDVKSKVDLISSEF
jgi:hypothetical protein